MKQVLTAQRALWRPLALSALLSLLLSPNKIQAQEEFNTGSTLETAEALEGQNLFTSERLEPVVLADPTFNEVPTFLGDLDQHLMSDELVNQLEDRYSMQLQYFSMQYGLIQHTRDSRLRRTYYGSLEQEREIRQRMAGSIRHYMIVRGIPKFLTSKDSTRFIGENYTKAVKFAQTATRVEIKSEDGKWQFNGGGNPFTTKLWAKYSNQTSTVEIYDFLDRQDSLAVIAFTRMGRYYPRITYFIEREGIEPGVRYLLGQNFEADLSTFIPYNSDSPFYWAVNRLSARYTF